MRQVKPLTHCPLTQILQLKFMRLRLFRTAIDRTVVDRTVMLTILTAIISGGLLQAPLPSRAEAQSDCFESGVIICPERGGDLDWNAAALPYIVQPRLTNLIDRRPTLEWAAVPEAESYAIELTDGVTGDVILSLPAVTKTRMAYPEDAPDLEPGTYYELEVTANTGAASWQAAINDGVAFEVLPGDRAADYATQANTQATSPNVLPSPGSAAIAQAELQQQFGLNQLAAETYREALERSDLDSEERFALWQQLGNLYWNKLELVPEAAIAYEQAYAIQPTGVLAEQLGTAMRSLNEREQALAYWDVAIAIYTANGDATAVQRVNLKRDRLLD
jgi:tetratricopeptide (TPR) repeat protein